MHGGVDWKCVDGEDVNEEGVMVRLLEVHISLAGRKDGPCPLGMLCHEVRSTRLRYSHSPPTVAVESSRAYFPLSLLLRSMQGRVKVLSLYATQVCRLT